MEISHDGVQTKQNLKNEQVKKKEAVAFVMNNEVLNINSFMMEIPII